MSIGEVTTVVDPAATFELAISSHESPSRPQQGERASSRTAASRVPFS